MTALEIRGLTAGYGETAVIDGLDLSVGAGETVAVLGPSGSGKTTLLLAVAGFVAPRAGTIAVGGALVAGGGTAVPPERRGVAMVFQGYGLWPHLDARATVAFPMEVRGVPRPEAARRAGELLRRVGMAGLEERRPGELSGGQQQRVGLARALATQASLLLLDEPTAHLDASTRAEVGAEMATCIAESGVAALLATHDAGEALGGGDRVAVLRGGAITQVDVPSRVYDFPVDEWTARLTGPLSVVEVDRHPGSGGRTVVTVGGESVETDVGGAVSGRLAVRPEWVGLGGPLPGVVSAVRFRGPHSDVVLDTPAGVVEVRAPGASDVAVGDRVGWTIERAWGV